MGKQLEEKSEAIEEIMDRLEKFDSSNECVKACLFNLIVYTHDPNRVDYFKKITSLIKEQFPCRLFFIEGSTAFPRERLTLNSKQKEGKERGSCNSIYICAGEDQLLHIPFLLLPLLIPDLPIYLLWGQNPAASSIILPSLEKLASRLIFDAEESWNVQEFAANLVNKILSSPAEIIDMNWARISGWREVLLKPTIALSG